MKAVISGLPELVNENQILLGQVILKAMHANGFRVNGVRIEFEKGKEDV